MDLDFILFSPPKIKYSFLDFWGQVIFIPKTKRKSKEVDSLFGSFLNCYKSTTANEVHLSIDAALLETKGFYDENLQMTTEETAEEEEVEKYIPCLYLNSMVNSKYLLLYFHASGEDIKLSHSLLNQIRNFFQINVIAMEYPGYSIYKGKTSSDVIKEDAALIYSYVTNKLGFKQANIIVMGRSIGTGISLQLMQKATPAALVLISPFASVKSLAREFIGSIGHFFAKETYDSLVNIAMVSCPIFFLHGKKDQIISFQNSIELSKKCYTKCEIKIPPAMTHSTFDFYQDLLDPLREFLMEEGINFYEPNMKGPQIPEYLFQCPQNFKI